MDKRLLAAFFISLIFLFPQIVNAEKLWQPQNSGINDTNIRSISIFPGNDNFICAGGLKQVYLSQNGGQLWEVIFSLGPEDTEINFVTFDQSDPKILYVATSDGLFATKNQGQRWQKIFRKLSETANNVRWIELDQRDYQRIYIGTDEGLYVSSDSGQSWKKSAGGLPRSQVRSIAVHPANSQVLYLANTYGLFKSIDLGQSWSRVYVTSYKADDEQDNGGNENNDETSEVQDLINCVAIDSRDNKRILIATSAGVLISPDAGESWNKLPSEGLTEDKVNFIVVSDKDGLIYAGSRDGVFELLPELNRWQEIYQGKIFRDVRSLTLNKGAEQLFAGTDQGVFKTVSPRNVQKQKKEERIEVVAVIEEKGIDVEQALKRLALSEPTIQEVQQAALRYAEVVHPERIRMLRRNAKLKALLPDVSLDYDKTVYGSSTTKVGFVGPRDWGLSFNWDVGDLVFNEQVRLLDGNARLMVQLRDDILDEVTRFYYQRRKLQIEHILTPPQTIQEKLIKVLRIEELTANIDGLTGGYFSQYIKRKKGLSYRK
ncbi:MAG: hypothetical protein NG712_05285 [Omnitrophica bacterium]|nr:hypothetical protein [Candidatus Omnitrophota bacterium]